MTESNEVAYHGDIRLNNLSSRFTTRNEDGNSKNDRVQEAEIDQAKEEDKYEQVEVEAENFSNNSSQIQNKDSNISHSRNEWDIQGGQNSEQIDPKSINDINKVKQKIKELEEQEK